MRYCLYNEDKSQTLKESPQGGAEFVLKEGVALPALPIALKTMKKDEKVSLILKPGCELLVSVPGNLSLHFYPSLPFYLIAYLGLQSKDGFL